MPYNLLENREFSLFRLAFLMLAHFTVSVHVKRMNIQQKSINDHKYKVNTKEFLNQVVINILAKKSRFAKDYFLLKKDTL